MRPPRPERRRARAGHRPLRSRKMTMMTDDLHYFEARRLVALLRARQISARELLQVHLDRIAAVNPQINAIVTLTPELAFARAHELDQMAARSEFAGPLHGLPMAHKDNHLTAGIRTTFGSRLCADLVPDADELV